MHQAVIPIVNEIFKRACEVEALNVKTPELDLEKYMEQIEEKTVGQVWQEVRDQPQNYKAGTHTISDKPTTTLMQWFLVQPVESEALSLSDSLNVFDEVVPNPLQLPQDLHTNFRKVSDWMRQKISRVGYVRSVTEPYKLSRKDNLIAESFEVDCTNCSQRDYCQDFGRGFVCLECYVKRK